MIISDCISASNKHRGLYRILEREGCSLQRVLTLPKGMVQPFRELTRKVMEQNEQTNKR